MASGDFTVRVLGPVQLVTSDGEVTDLPSASQRRLLAALALHAPRPVRTEWLCDVLDVTPGALRTLVARLRKAVGEGVLHTSAVGYRLDAPVDATRARIWNSRPVIRERSDARSRGGSRRRFRSLPTSRGRWPMPYASTNGANRRSKTSPTP